jgi:uncharacterized protein (TIGR00730 family)
MNKFRVSVFCASSSKVDPKYIGPTEQLAEALVEAGWLIQYGGGGIGLMGALANTVLKQQGTIKGIIPQFMIDEGWVHIGVETLEIVPDMHERKRRIMGQTDAIVALPGGCGTLEELTEAITLKQLGLIGCPIIVVNLFGFYDPLLQFFDTMVEERLLRPEHKKLWQVVDHASEVIPAIEKTSKWDSRSARNIAAI